MSSITTTTNKIDVLYPIAGQENSSQGFRDNFLNIKLSLTETAAEIISLQNNSVSKISSDNDMSGNQITSVSLKNLGLTTVLNQIASLSVTPVFYDQGSYQEYNLSADTTFVVYNWRDSGVCCPLRLLIKGTAGNRITFGAVPGGNGSVYSDQSFPFQLTGDDITVWDIWTADDGTTIYVTKIGASFGLQ